MHQPPSAASGDISAVRVCASSSKAGPERGNPACVRVAARRCPLAVGATRHARFALRHATSRHAAALLLPPARRLSPSLPLHMSPAQTQPPEFVCTVRRNRPLRPSSELRSSAHRAQTQADRQHPQEDAPLLDAPRLTGHSALLSFPSGSAATHNHAQPRGFCGSRGSPHLLPTATPPPLNDRGHTTCSRGGTSAPRRVREPLLWLSTAPGFPRWVPYSH